MARRHGPQIKDPQTYEALLEDGASREKAARIANVKAADTLDGRGERLEDRSNADLYAEAKRIGIARRGGMTKAALIDAIRSH